MPSQKTSPPATRFFIGTSGYSYKEWKGSFYPAKLPAKEMLRFYAERFGTVEANNTFYRMPSESVLAAWAEQVPESFRFVLKAPQTITHRKRLKEADDATAYFLKTAAVLGERLGPVLFQLPPNMKKDLPRFDAFLALLPETTRAAFEFRHASWFDDEVFARLRARDLALCLNDVDDVFTELVPTAGWGYVRLRREAYTDEELAGWVATLRAQSWSHAYVFFRHEDTGTGPQFAGRLQALVDAGT